MGNWFSQESRGLVFGFWCTCQNIGNIGGNLLVNLLREQAGLSWMWSLRIVGIWVGVLAIFNFLLLVDDPSKVGIVIDPSEEESEGSKSSQSESLDGKIEEEKVTSNRKESDINNEENSSDITSEEQTSSGVGQDNNSQNIEEEEQGISFWKAWIIPGVIPYAICIAFVK
mmetsp:Transcript_17756/g.19931  ORF Transcript_17756/g.19931 Transcript_17756/m.19931 type:complete len:170 (-) Transcript_17756:178-687(-)